MPQQQLKAMLPQQDDLTQVVDQIIKDDGGDKIPNMSAPNQPQEMEPTRKRPFPVANDKPPAQLKHNVR